MLEHDFRHSMLFDLAKLHQLVPGFRPRISFSDGAADIIRYHDADPARRRADADLDAAFDRMLSP